METSRGVVKVVITSAEPLKKKSLDTIQAAVLAMAGQGKQVL
jgi:F0F1-type ATP synthase delta subunit